MIKNISPRHYNNNSDYVFVDSNEYIYILNNHGKLKEIVCFPKIVFGVINCAELCGNDLVVGTTTGVLILINILSKEHKVLYNGNSAIVNIASRFSQENNEKEFFLLENRAVLTYLVYNGNKVISIFKHKLYMLKYFTSLNSILLTLADDLLFIVVFPCYIIIINVATLISRWVLNISTNYMCVTKIDMSTKNFAKVSSNQIINKKFNSEFQLIQTFYYRGKLMCLNSNCELYCVNGIFSLRESSDWNLNFLKSSCLIKKIITNDTSTDNLLCLNPEHRLISISMLNMNETLTDYHIVSYRAIKSILTDDTKNEINEKIISSFIDGENLYFYESK